MAAEATFTPVSASVALNEIVGRAEVANPLLGGWANCTTGAIVSIVEKLKLKGAVCTLPLASASWFTVTLKVLLEGSGAAGVKTACVGVASTVLPATAPPVPLTVIRLVKPLAAARGSVKLTVMVALAAT